MTDSLDSSLIPATPYADTLALAGQIANQAAAEKVFVDYLSRIARQTIRRQAADLTLFALYLEAAHPGLGQPIAHFAQAIRLSPVESEPPRSDAWQGMTWGLVAGFVQWQLQQGYAVGSVNVRLATIKVYCALAHQAGGISTQEYVQIQLVKGYGQKQAKKVDEKRETSRRGDKKAEAVSLTKEQADKLKNQPNTPQGRRDRVLMCLLLDHGLRCGEIASLQVTDFNLQEGTFTFYREKVDKVQTHKLTWDTLRAVRRARLYLSAWRATSACIKITSAGDPCWRRA